MCPGRHIKVIVTGTAVAGAAVASGRPWQCGRSRMSVDEMATAEADTTDCPHLKDRVRDCRARDSHGRNSRLMMVAEG